MSNVQEKNVHAFMHGNQILDWYSGLPIANFEGLCFADSRRGSAIMRTWIDENGERAFRCEVAAYWTRT